MTQQNKAGIFFGAVLALVLVSYLFFSAKNETIKYSSNEDIQVSDSREEINQLEKIGQAEIESNYKKNMKKLLNDFEAKIAALESWKEEGDLPDGGEVASTSLMKKQEELEMVLGDISELKVGVMEMIVPEDHRDLHLALVKELTDIKEELIQENQFDKKTLLAIVEKSKTEREWLQ